MAGTGAFRFLQGPTGVVAGGAAAVVVAVGGYLLYQAVLAPEPAGPAEVEVAVQPETPEVPEAPGTAPSDDAPGQEASPPAEPEPEVAAAPDAAPEPTLPGFDLVRISPDGSAVIAGQAMPGADVEILLDGAEVARTPADATGNFVALLTVPPAATPRVLTLASILPDGTRVMSEQTAIVSPVVLAEAQEAPVPPSTAPEAPGAPALPPSGSPAPVVPDVDGAVAPQGTAQAPGTPAGEAVATAESGVPVPEAETPGPSIGAGGGETPLPEPVAPGAPPPAPAAPPALSDSPAAPETAVASGETAGEAATATAEGTTPPAPRVMVADETGITVVQSGGPEVLEQVTIDSISYDPEGEVALSGRGTGAASVRIYLDNRPVRTALIEEDGQWRAPLPDVESGVYTLRVDEIGVDGSVTSRVETPFLREEPEQLARAAAEAAAAPLPGAPDAGEPVSEAAAPPVQVVTVQPGSTLWAIARQRYGSGFLYVRVFDANRDQIRDPDLIYPGQVFTLPSEVE